MVMNALEFLTTVSGHTCMSDPRTAVLPEVAEVLMPLMQHGGGKVPGLPAYSFTVQAVQAGMWAIEVSGPTLTGSGSIVRCILCSSDEAAPAAWQRVMMASNDGREHLFPPPKQGSQPRTTPWLAAVLLDPPATIDDLLHIGSFEKAVACMILNLSAKEAQQ